MRRTILSLLALLGSATVAAATPRTFVLVIDGMEPENVSRDLTPVLCDLARCDGQDLSEVAAKSASYANAQAVITTTTNANHAAMVTGVYADANGIVANTFFDRDAGVTRRADNIGLLTAETLFTTVKKAGASDVTTAGVVGKGKIGHLLLDCDDAVNGCGPAHNFSPDFVIEGTSPDKCHVDPADPRPEQVESCLLVGEPITGDERSNDTQVMNEILLLSQTRDPKIFFVNFPDVDNYQHVFGVRSAVALEVIANVDKQIGRIIQYLKLSGKWDDSILLITADHSFGDVGDPVPHGNKADGSADPFSLANPDVRVNNPVTGRGPVVAGAGIGGTRVVMADLLAPCGAKVGACPTSGTTSLDLCVQLYDTGMAGVVALTPTGTESLACAASKAAARSDCISGVFRNESTTDVSAGAAPFPDDWHLGTGRAADLIFAATDRCALLDSQTSSAGVLSGDHGHLTARHVPFIAAGGPESIVKAAGSISTGHQAENVDIAPTVLAVYGIAAPAGALGQRLCGALALSGCP